jgi:acyl carrier protein
MDLTHHGEPELTDWTDEVTASAETTGATAAEQVCRSVVAAHLELGVEAVQPWQHLEKELGITRLGLVLIGLDLEDLEHVTLPFELLGEVETVAQLGRFLKAARRATRRLPVAEVNWPRAR